MLPFQTHGNDKNDTVCVAANIFPLGIALN